MGYATDLDYHYMGLAIEAAKLCVEHKKFAAVVVCDGRVIVTACSAQGVDCDITRHAELVAISKASQALKGDTSQFRHCTLYTTCEPCMMCWGAVLWAKIGRVVYGMEPTQSPHNFCDSYAVYRAHHLPLNGPGLPNPEVRGGVRADECLELMPPIESDLWMGPGRCFASPDFIAI